MAKDKRNKTAAVQAQANTAPLLSKKGWRLVGSGLTVVILGFIVLSFTDSAGQNTASHVSPFLILGGYALIGLGLCSKPTN